MKRILLALVLVSAFAFAACTDSDGGRVYGVYGSCTDAFKERVDSCLGNKLTEYYCSGSTLGECTALDVSCASEGFDSCVAGACTADAAPSIESDETGEVASAEESDYAYNYDEELAVVEPKLTPAETLPLWVVACALAVLFVAFYELSLDRMESKKSKKKVKKK
ncbi:MAG: hypothetical protein WC607_00135 [Candidatus Micrarchaeia archaeon]